MLNGGSVENVWQPMSAEMWNAPDSRSTSFMAEKLGRAPLRGHEAAVDPGNTGGVDAARRSRRNELRHPGEHDLTRVLAGHRQAVLAVHAGRVHLVPPQHREDRLLEVRGLAFLDDEHRVLVRAEPNDLLRHERIGHVQAVDRERTLAECVRETELLERAHDRVVHPALADDADV